MLDFSKYHRELAIFRTESNATLWKQLGMSITEKSTLFAVFPNRTVEKIDGTENRYAHAIRSYISKHNLIPNIDERELEEISLSQNVLQNSDTRNKDTKSDHVNAYQNRLLRHQKLSMVDFETALSYMLRREIPRTKEIQEDAYDALLHWLIVLTKVFDWR